jgi:tRNA uracil 4-sulfurtransferase
MQHENEALPAPSASAGSAARDGGSALGPAPALLVRYGELALKGDNRDQFIARLQRNVKRQTVPIAHVRVERLYNRMLVLPAARAEEVARKLQDVFGIKSISPVWTCAAEPAAIIALARGVLADALRDHDLRDGRRLRFRVETKRADKRFPILSNAFDRMVGEAILPAWSGIEVDLEHAELTLGIDVRAEGAYLFARRMAGLGGLPVGTSGRGLCLLSGGIDSPVAAWMTMKRGMWTSCITYHSSPYIGEASKEKVIELARHLARFQPSLRLYVVPFTACQEAIRDGAPEAYRTVLYRRMMQRIAARIAHEHGLDALITGESLGQVASQTIENITCIGAASDLPVLRPLVGFDKDDTIQIARRIGTFDISNRQQPDCCTVFLPPRPVIHGELAVCENVERELPVAELVEQSCAGVELVDLEDGA